MKNKVNTIPKGWKETTLGEVAEITSSKRIFANEYLTRGIPFYRGKEIIEKYNGNKVSTDLFISENKFHEIEQKFGAPKAGEILLTSVGTLGIPYLVRDEEKFYFKDGNLTWFKNFNGIDNKFLYYWIISDSGKEQLASNTIGSTQQALTIVGLKSILINLPPLPEQRAIAAILSSLDDKINLLQEKNKTLEAIAQAIFREWFVNFNFPGATGKMIDSELGKIPEGWRAGRFVDISEILGGGTPKTNVKEYWGGKIPFFTPKDAKDVYCLETEKNITDAGLNNCNSRLYPKNTVFITARGTVGKCVLASSDMAINQSCYALVGKKTSNIFIYMYAGYLVNLIQKVASGGVFDAITTATFESMEVIIPVKDVEVLFTLHSQSIF
jgi:type I restriction enzyme S subunit